MMRYMQTNGDRSTTGHTTGPGVRQRYTIPQAAKILGLTEEAVRQRVKRGTLDSIKVEGKLFVLLQIDRSDDVSRGPEEPVNDTSKDTSDDLSKDTLRLVDALEDEVAHLRRQLDQANERDRENRRIIAGLVQRVPELEAARDFTSEAPESPVTASEGTNSTGASQEPQEPSQRRSLLYRFFFGPE
jgi:hypothetical protein